MQDELVYPRERRLGAITLVLGLLAWLLIIVGTFGLALVYIGIGFVFYLFAHSALIAWLRGNGVLLSAQQLPDLRARFDACCAKLGIDDRPEAYVLLSDIVDAMQANPDGVNFYIGHELGHVRMKHLTGRLLRAPVLWLPLLGAAYSRAKESTCDRHGRACCEGPESAARALVALAAGAQRWRMVDLPAFEAQAALSRGFWMSYHELTGGYPWLTKRVARVLHPDAAMPRRNGFAYFFALFSPYVGRGGGAAGVLVVAMVIGILFAVALPAYKDYEARARLTSAYIGSMGARKHLADYYAEHNSAPASLADAGVPTTLADGTRLSLDADSMVLTVETPNGELVLTPHEGQNGLLSWQCSVGDGVKASRAPAACRGGAPVDLSE